MATETRLWVPLANETDPLERKRREDHAAKLVRRQRVERFDLEPCVRCGGAAEATADGEVVPEVEADPTLRCVCEESDRDRLARRLVRLHHDHLTERDDDDVSLADRIAP